MFVTDDLVHEHEVIKRMLAIMERACRKVKAGSTVQMTFFEGAVSFLRQFADKCHHGKEEEVLFPALEKTGISVEGGPIGQMLNEHEEGRAYISKIKEGVENGDIDTIVEAAEKYIDLLRLHIVKENDVLFLLANQRLKQSEADRIESEFERIEIEVVGPGMHDKLLGDLDRLEKLVG